MLLCPTHRLPPLEFANCVLVGRGVVDELHYMFVGVKVGVEKSASEDYSNWRKVKRDVEGGN